MRIGLFVVAMLAAAFAMGDRAEAQNYPWCAQYSGGSMGGGTNCGFITFQQCLDRCRACSNLLFVQDKSRLKPGVSPAISEISA